MYVSTALATFACKRKPLTVYFHLQFMDTSTIQFGPCASDVAIFLASQIYFYNRHMLTPENNDKHRRVAYKLMDVCKLLGDYECRSLLHYQSHRMLVMWPLSVNVG